MYSSYYDTFGLTEDHSLSVFDEESLDISEASSPQAAHFPSAAPINDSIHGPEFLSDLHRALKALRKAAQLSPMLQLSSETLLLLQTTQTSMNDLCLRVASEVEGPSLSSGSSPIDEEMQEIEPIRSSTLTFPDYSAVLRPKVVPVTPKSDVKKDKPQTVNLPSPPVTPAVPREESQEISFTTLNFGADGSGVPAVPRTDDLMGPPKSRKGSKRNGKAPYSDHLKAWRSQPYGPRQLAKQPDDLMMEFVLDPTTTAHENHTPFESAEFFITPPSAHQYNRQLN